MAKVDADNLRYAIEKISVDATERNAKLVAALAEAERYISGAPSKEHEDVLKQIREALAR